MANPTRPQRLSRRAVTAGLSSSAAMLSLHCGKPATVGAPDAGGGVIDNVTGDAGRTATDAGATPLPTTDTGTRPPLPSWIPMPGDVATLAVGAGLANSFISQCAPFYEPFHFAKTVNDYSGATFNPYFGRYGAFIYFGGGHAGTNDNTVSAMVLESTGISFRRLSTPSAIFGNGIDSVTRGRNSIEGFGEGVHLDPKTCQYQIDGQPASPHSYGSLITLPPSATAAAGSLFVPVLAAVGYHLPADMSSLSSFRMDFASAGEPVGSANWKYLASHPTYPYGAAIGSVARAPIWACFEPAKNRVHYVTRNPIAPRWFDVASNRYVEGNGRQLDQEDHVTDTGQLIVIPERKLMLFLDKVASQSARPDAGKLRISYMDLNAAEPSWNTSSARFQQPIALPDGWSCATWCPDNSRVILGNAADDNQAVYEIEIPNDLTAPWPVTRAPFGPGQTVEWTPNNCFGKWTYNPLIRAIAFMANASSSGQDIVKVYRPRGT